MNRNSAHLADAIRRMRDVEVRGDDDISKYLSERAKALKNIQEANADSEPLNQIEEEQRRVDAVYGENIGYSSNELGRRIEKDDDILGEEPYRRYDVRVIGGYAWDNDTMAGDPYTVNDAEPEGYGETNHALETGLTKEEVESGSWSWPTVEDKFGAHFAIVAVTHGVDPNTWPSTVDPQWWNNKIPLNQLWARSLDNNGWTEAGDITLTLKFGVFESE